jgi:hypothetical protein
MKQLSFKIVIIVFFLLSISNLSAEQYRNDYIGRTYKAEISVSCKKFIDGGCTLFRYCVLEFEKDSVMISSYVRASCIPERNVIMYEENNFLDRKKYKWTKKESIIFFEDLDQNKYGFSSLSPSISLNGKQNGAVLANDDFMFIQISDKYQ